MKKIQEPRRIPTVTHHNLQCPTPMKLKFAAKRERRERKEEEEMGWGSWLCKLRRERERRGGREEREKKGWGFDIFAKRVGRRRGRKGGKERDRLCSLRFLFLFLFYGVPWLGEILGLLFFLF